MPTPPPRRRRRHDGVYVASLAVLLIVGVLGVLLLNTSMQQQADRLAAQRQLIAKLTLEAQTLRTAVDEAAAPAPLAAKARHLRMHPTRHLRFVAVSHGR